MTTGAAAGRGVILMAVYNGERHLREQLQSLADQTFQDWDLIASDDGSQDGSRALLQDVARAWTAAEPDRRHDLTILSGPGRGLVRNFFHLLQTMPATAAFAALSDQDDVWFPGKLDRALAALAAIPPERPALYCARTMICDEALRPLRPSVLFRRSPGFRNALVQSAGGGNTMVLNPGAIALVRSAVAEAQEAAVHDWWLYQIITACGGTVLRDAEPVLLYRQHGANAIGVNTSVRGRIHRILFIMGRRFSAWNDINLRALAASRHRFTPEARAVLDHYAEARRGGALHRMRALTASGVYRQRRIGTLALYAACLAGRL